MKQYLLFGFVLILSFAATAQKSTGKVVLAMNQELKLTSSLQSSISQELMGQSMETKMDVSTAKKIVVKNITPENYQLDATTTHIKMDMSLMGEARSFDSNNAADMSGDMKDAGKSVNVTKPMVLDIKGKTIAPPENKPAGEATDPMTQLMEQLLGNGSEESILELYFMLIPEGKKQGDSWSDSTIAGNSRTSWTYTWESSQQDTAVIKAVGKLVSKGLVNVQGMEMNVSTTNDITETRRVGLNNGIVYNKNSVAKSNGAAEVMGQSIPMTGTITIITTAE